jgi:hypothetical protein
LGVAPPLIAAPGFTLQLRLAAKAGQSGVSGAIPNAQAVRVSKKFFTIIATFNCTQTQQKVTLAIMLLYIATPIYKQ